MLASKYHEVCGETFWSKLKKKSTEVKLIIVKLWFLLQIHNVYFSNLHRKAWDSLADLE